ncbi:Anaphase-promoting complex subunit 1 [Neophaeococcomyces mojaviensis]|uniref:Anaphase-promoting complex subunit 1 n=1 Tax=Neophaeococcomyces mojaviensis TaxID=3383035 RepID=A0ACC3A7X0_9EURO|nr:Anaphase-promoting complex subunit 1 [Knufia sp. JES_112]
MAQLHSTGLHKPSALQHLIDEGILPQNPDASTYEWTQQISLDDQDVPVVEEVLRVDSCVVWSRNGIIRRVFNLNIENEAVNHAFATTFSASSNEPLSAIGGAKVRNVSTSTEPALVVILKTQAHIFCFSGGIHVVPLSFEVARALPCRRGFLLQPEAWPEVTTRGKDEALSTSRWETASVQTTRASFLVGDAQEPIRADRTTRKRLPTYCITELLSDMGVVAASYARKAPELSTCPLLPCDEELLYVSTDYDVSPRHGNSTDDISIAVTLNRTTSAFTVWQVGMCASETDSTATTSRESDTARYRKRQSSNIHERARIPSGRGQAETSRESLGGLIQSFVDTSTKPQEPQLSNIENLAAELGHDFEPSGVQTRSARRISSMLARSDLAPSKERSAFNENALGFAGRKSLSRSLRKEGSFGSFTDRNSFGGRKSFPATSTIVSNTASFLDAGNRLSIRDSLAGGATEDIDIEVSNERLERDLVFIKLKNFLCDAKSTEAPQSSFKVMLIPHPESTSADGSLQSQVSICVQELQAEVMTVVTLVIKATTHHSSRYRWPELKAIQIQKGTSITGACKISEQTIKRLLILSKTSQGDDVLHLEAPWSASFRVDLPNHYFVHNTRQLVDTDPTSRKHEAGSRRTIDGTQVKVAKFLCPNNLDNLVFADRSGRIHELSILLAPQKNLSRRILEVCKFVLPAQLQDSLLVAYWEIFRWLQSQDVTEDPEWTAVTVALFTMAVPFISALQNKAAGSNRRKKGLNVRLSGGSLTDSTSWSSMYAAERARSSSTWMQNTAWTWMQDEIVPTTKLKSPSKHSRRSSVDVGHDLSNTFMLQCTDLARDFLQSPAGESMNGPEGYLPTAMNQDRSTRRTSLASMLVALHLLLNELKLEGLADESLANDQFKLGSIITQLGSWLNWFSWKSPTQLQYSNDIQDGANMVFDQGTIDTLEVPPEPFAPSSVFEFIDSTLRSQPFKFHTLVELIHNPDSLAPDHPSVVAATRLLPRLSTVITVFGGKFSSPPAAIGLKLEQSLQAILPDAVAAACQYAVRLSKRGANATASSVYNDVESALRGPKQEKSASSHVGLMTTHVATRDVRAIAGQALDAESLSRWDMSSEVDRQAVTKLIFNQDRRFQEASKLVNQTRAPEIEYDMQPNWTEADALEAQKLLAQYATRRTFSVATGRGMMHFNARTPLLTEMVPVPRFSLQCIMKPRIETDSTQPMTFSADRALFTEDKVCWAFFHNGASAGLMISKEADFIDTSWILYNKPAELTNRHAGFLLALGLNGHLKSLAKWVAFKYLTPKHTMTSVGLLLGLAASYRGTADTLITRLLSVHVTCLLPLGAAELNLSPLTQTTGIIGIGLLYHGSQHRRMSEVMLSEIENKDAEERTGDEAILRDEGYRLGAGISLGLINLGQGLRLHGLHDMRVVERLIAIAIGTKNVNLVHVLDRATAGAVIAVAFIYMKTNDASIARKVDIPDTMHQFDYVRPDVFLLRTLARHLIMWDKIQPTQDFIQGSLPNQYRHRADLKTVKRLITNDLPFLHMVAGICFAIALRYAGSQRHDARDLLISYLDQFLRISRLPALSYDAKVTLNGIRNCLDILALSSATVMAGSGDLIVFRRLRALHGRTDKDTPFGSHLAAHMAIGALFLSGGTATFGTSNLAVASLVIAFYPLFPTDVLDNRGHLQALRHLWVLAVEHRCLVARDADSGQIIGNIDATLHLVDGTTSMHRIPSILPDLDQVRRITVSAEDFWPIAIDLDQHIQSSNSTSAAKTSQAGTLRKQYESSPTGILITLHRRALYDKPNVDPFNAELQALDEARGVPSINPTAASARQQVLSSLAGNEMAATPDSPLDWIFNLSAFQHLDHAERALILSGSSHPHPHADIPHPDPHSTGAGGGADILAGTPIDTALDLELGTLGPDAADLDNHIPANMQKLFKRDRLWQIRLLLSWADKVEQEEQDRSSREGERTWLRKEVIERLRWRIWMLGGDGDDEGGKEL